MIALVVIVGLIGIANVSSLLSGSKKAAPQSALTMSPTTPNAQQVSSFETQQQNQAKHDAEEMQRQQALAKAMQELQQEQSVPSPESAGTPPMTAAQRQQIYGDSSNAPQQTSNMSEARAEAKQKRLAIEKQSQDAQNSDTVAIDFSHEGASPLTAVKAASVQATDKASGEEFAGKPQSKDAASSLPAKNDPMSSYILIPCRGRGECGRRWPHRRLPRSGAKCGTDRPFHTLHGSGISTVLNFTKERLRKTRVGGMYRPLI